ncbi:hypothetical protein BaRGS_00038901 [Batillaria attramentaria]|uniref:C17orf113 probable zinc finger domain-containing protein n=1 Tax=Batillaria attramentaria TaxID=370345 RepID=A0ABD0J4G5_9CAEN
MFLNPEALLTRMTRWRGVVKTELPLSSEAPSGTPSPPSHEPELGAKSKDVENESTKPPARQLVSSWFKVFPWLVYNEKTRTMFCSECMEDGVAKNSFTRGCGNLRKFALSDPADADAGTKSNAS